jgi:hypothetical protein
MVTVSREARQRIREHGTTVCRIRQRGVPVDVPLWLPLVNPLVEKQLLFRAQYRLMGITLAEAREGILFADYSRFMDMKLEEWSRANRTRHFRMNPFTKKLGEVLGPVFGASGVRAGAAVAAFMVRMLGLVEWEMAEDEAPSPDLAVVRVKVKSRFFKGRFVFRIERDGEDVIVDDNWLPEGGGDVRTPAFPMGVLVLNTHPLGFEQIAEETVEEILRARAAGRPYVGEIDPSAREVA